MAESAPARRHHGRLDEESARAALTAACAAVGLAPDADLVRLGENAVFRLTGAAVVARVSRDVSSRPSIRRQLAVARWLAEADLRTVREWEPGSQIGQPLEADGQLVTFWQSVNDDIEYGTTAQLGEVLRHLHRLTSPHDLNLPDHDPFERIYRRLDAVDTLDDEDLAFLRGRAAQLKARYRSLPWQLPRGPIHDDANVGNLLKDRGGNAVLSDLDSFCIGPREWDLVQTALFYDRLGWHDEREYADFVEAYGCDLLAWPGYPTVADVRELVMTTWLSQEATPGSEKGEELSRRLKDLRTGASRKGWRPL